ncbi:MAG: CPBP family intramembrane metalloprotease, partial [Bacteroidales bacterium]|nr:CPBP family intramembrane metalloprotease [Bacteroidales bacterium]
MRNQIVLFLGLITIIIFGGFGILIIENVQGIEFSQLLGQGWRLPLQILTGAAYGFIASLIANYIVSRPFFADERKFYHRIVSRLNLDTAGIIFVSLCAGIGEEIFFRGALQPLIGLWTTAILFVLLHGYLNPFNWRISIYGVVMVVFIAGMGYLFRYTGLVTAMTAHAVLDMML